MIAENDLLAGPPPGAGFHPLENLWQSEELGKNTEEFIGDGTPYLRCPGLLTCTAVRAAGAQIPETLTFKVPITGNDHPEYRIDTWPGWSLDRGLDGVPVLRRSAFSNDGLWQKGMTVYVTGEWDRAIVPEPTEPKLIPKEAPQRPVLLQAGADEGTVARGKGR